MEAGDAADEKIKASEHAAKNHKMLHAATLKKLQAKDEELAEMKKKWDEAERQVSLARMAHRHHLPIARSPQLPLLPLLPQVSRLKSLLEIEKRDKEDWIRLVMKLLSYCRPVNVAIETASTTPRRRRPKAAAPEGGAGQE